MKVLEASDAGPEGRVYMLFTLAQGMEYRLLGTFTSLREAVYLSMECSVDITIPILIFNDLGKDAPTELRPHICTFPMATREDLEADGKNSYKYLMRAKPAAGAANQGFYWDSRPWAHEWPTIDIIVRCASPTLALAMCCDLFQEFMKWHNEYFDVNYELTPWTVRSTPAPAPTARS